MFLTQYIYETGFASLLRNPGLAAAASILMGVVLVVLTLLQLGLGRRNERREARDERASRIPLPPPRRHAAGTGPTSSPGSG